MKQHECAHTQAHCPWAYPHSVHIRGACHHHCCHRSHHHHYHYQRLCFRWRHGGCYRCHCCTSIHICLCRCQCRHRRFLSPTHAGRNPSSLYLVIPHLVSVGAVGVGLVNWLCQEGSSQPELAGEVWLCRVLRVWASRDRGIGCANFVGWEVASHQELG